MYTVDAAIESIGFGRYQCIIFLYTSLAWVRVVKKTIATFILFFASFSL